MVYILHVPTWRLITHAEWVSGGKLVHVFADGTNRPKRFINRDDARAWLAGQIARRPAGADPSVGNPTDYQTLEN